MLARLGALGRTRRAVSALAAAVAIGLALAPASPALAATAPAMLSGTMYFTTYQNQGWCTPSTGTSAGTCTPNVFKTPWSYDGTTLTIGSSTTVATTKGADGIVFTPSGTDLLVGGQEANQIYDVDPSTGTVTASNAGKNAYHLVVDPNGGSVWGFGSQGDNVPAAGARVPLPVDPTTPGTDYPVTKADGSSYGVTELAFVPAADTGLGLSSSQEYENKYAIFYTAGRDDGYGDFGYLVPGSGDSFVAHPLQTGVHWAHGLKYDPFTGDLLATGSNMIVQIDPSVLTPDPATFSIVSSYTAPANAGGTPQLDQVTTDGQGQLFVADNHGYVYFVDYSKTSMIGDPTNVTADQHLAAALDDVAVTVATAPTVSGFVTGGGWITDPANGDKGTFGLVAKTHTGGPKGSTEFQLHGADINFHSTSYTSLNISGCWATYTGTGTVNGSGDYTFTVQVKDDRIAGCGGSDEFGITIVDATTGGTFYSVAPQNVLHGTGIQIHE